MFYLYYTMSISILQFKSPDLRLRWEQKLYIKAQSIKNNGTSASQFSFIKLTYPKEGWLPYLSKVNQTMTQNKNVPENNKIPYILPPRHLLCFRSPVCLSTRRHIRLLCRDEEKSCLCFSVAGIHIYFFHLSTGKRKEEGKNRKREFYYQTRW